MCWTPPNLDDDARPGPPQWRYASSPGARTTGRGQATLFTGLHAIDSKPRPRCIRNRTFGSYRDRTLLSSVAFDPTDRNSRRRCLQLFPNRQVSGWTGHTSTADTISADGGDDKSRDLVADDPDKKEHGSDQAVLITWYIVTVGISTKSKRQRVTRMGVVSPVGRRRICKKGHCGGRFAIISA